MRRFLIKISYTVLPLWLLFFSAGVAYKYYIRPNQTGDLGRLGKLPFGHEYQRALNRNLLKKCWVEDFNGKLTKGYKVITIGDSFSQQGKAGYQNYLGDMLKDKVLNIRPAEGVTPEQLALSLLRTDCLKKMSPQVVVVETVERNLVKSLLALDFSERPSIASVRKHIYKKKHTAVRESANNLYETVYWLRLCLGIDDPVKKMELDKDLFSLSGDELYFYYADLERTSMEKKEKERVCAALDSLRQEFRQQGIHFIYMVAADKYHVYEPFIEDNIYPACTQLDFLSEMPGQDDVVNTLNVLRPLVRQGVKDVYMANDSHWSYIASETVAGEIITRFQAAGIAGRLKENTESEKQGEKWEDRKIPGKTSPEAF